MADFREMATHAWAWLLEFAWQVALISSYLLYMLLPLLMVIVVVDCGRAMREMVVARVEVPHPVVLLYAGWVGRLTVVWGIFVTFCLTALVYALTQEGLAIAMAVTASEMPKLGQELTGDALVWVAWPLEAEFWHRLTRLDRSNPVLNLFYTYVVEMDNAKGWEMPFALQRWSLRWGLTSLAVLVWVDAIKALLTVPKTLATAYWRQHPA